MGVWGDWRKWGLTVSYTHLRAHETPEPLVSRLLREKKNGWEVVVGVWGDWRKWGLMRAGGLSGFLGVGWLIGV